MIPIPAGASARSRLLPFSVPFRYFGAAAAFHVLAWGALLAGAEAFADFGGGLGPVFAALHLITLGVLATAAVGASLQLLPIATRQPVRSVGAAKLVWWFMVPGTSLFALGAGLHAPRMMAPGAMLALGGLAVYGWLLAENLRRAQGLRVVILYGWAALGALALAAASGLALVARYEHGLDLDHGAFRAAHLVLAAYGFMGLLAMGLSQFLLPMFALAPAPAPRTARFALGLAAAGILLATASLLLVPSRAGLAIAAGLGLAAALAHVVAMERALARRMPRPLGPAFLLMRVSWACLIASLLLGGWIALGSAPARSELLFGVLLVPGWLLSFVLAVLQRIVPFLATVHAGGGTRPAPLVSALTPTVPLAAHRMLHLAALAGLIAAAATGATVLAQLAAATGLAAAAAFAVFFVHTLLRLREARLPAQPAGLRGRP